MAAPVGAARQAQPPVATGPAAGLELHAVRAARLEPRRRGRRGRRPRAGFSMSDELLSAWKQEQWTIL